RALGTRSWARQLLDRCADAVAVQPGDTEGTRHRRSLRALRSLYARLRRLGAAIVLARTAGDCVGLMFAKPVGRNKRSALRRPGATVRCGAPMRQPLHRTRAISAGLGGRRLGRGWLR